MGKMLHKGVHRLVIVLLIVVCMAFVFRDRAPAADWDDVYKRKLRQGSVNPTVNCMSWESLNMKPLNGQHPNRAKEDWMLRQRAQTESSQDRKSSFVKMFEEQKKGFSRAKDLTKNTVDIMC